MGSYITIAGHTLDGDGVRYALVVVP